MISASEQLSARQVVVGLAAVVIVLGGMRVGAPLVAPALLGMLIAATVIPLQRSLGHRIGRSPAFVVTLSVVLVAIFVFVILLGVSAYGFSRGLLVYASRSDDVARQAQALVSRFGLDSQDLMEMARRRVGENVEGALELVADAAKAVGDFTLMVLVVAFVLADAVALREKTWALDRMTKDSVERLQRVIEDVTEYLKLVAAAGVVNGLACTLLFLAFGVDYAPLWGVLIVVLGFVPYVGFWIALVPPATLVTLERGLVLGIVVVLGSLLIHSVTGSVLKPRIISYGLDLSPFTVFYSVAFWAFVLGPVGAILSVPLTILIREVLIDADPRLQWLSMLMGRRPE